jgi:hypothetical protein
VGGGRNRLFRGGHELRVFSLGFHLGSHQQSQRWSPTGVAAHMGGHPQGLLPTGVAAHRGGRPQGVEGYGMAGPSNMLEMLCPQLPRF